MRFGGVASARLALTLLLASLPAVSLAHHPGGSRSFWMGGYIVSAYPPYGWGAYNPSPVVTGMNVFGAQAGPAFNGMPVNNVPGNGVAAAGVANPAMMNAAGGPVAGAQAGAGGGPDVGVPALDPPQHGKPRPTNTESKARAGKFIQYGDAQFAKQKYNSALQRYRDAATAAPDLAETYFRQVFALLGTSQYESAKKALDRGLRVRPNWPDSHFELNTLYGPRGQLAKRSHREALASAIEQSPQSADLLLLMGVMLYCDGEPARSQPFFERAIELGGNADHLFDRFIAPRPAEGDQAAGEQPGPAPAPQPGKF